MEIVVLALAILTVLAALASLFGRDSRDALRSPEQDLAAHGVTWGDPTLDQKLAAELRMARQRPRVATGVQPIRPRHAPETGVPSRAVV